MPKNHKKIRAKNRAQVGKYPVTTTSFNESLTFSFKYLDDTNVKFKVENIEKDWFVNYTLRLKEVSRLTIKELKVTHCQNLRCHPIDFSKTTEPGGFGIRGFDDLDAEPFQLFQLSKRTGRIHGFFISSTFYIVWLDPDHELYD